MAPEAGRDVALVVAVDFEALLEKDLYKGARLGESIDVVPDLKVHPAICVNKVLHVVLVRKVQMNVRQLDADVLWAVVGGVGGRSS